MTTWQRCLRGQLRAGRATRERYLRELVGLRPQTVPAIFENRYTSSSRVPVWDRNRIRNSNGETISESAGESDSESDSNDGTESESDGESDSESDSNVETESESDYRDVLVLWGSRRGEPQGCLLRLSRNETSYYGYDGQEYKILRVRISIPRPGGRWVLNSIYFPRPSSYEPCQSYRVSSFRPGIPLILSRTALIIAFNE